MKEKKIDRREVIKKAVYIAPAILTLIAIPSTARSGSQYEPQPRRIWRKW